MPDLLNIGCGSTYFPEWTNLDISGGDTITRHDVYNGLPFGDESCGAVYSSDLLEHLHRRFVPILLGECWRVLRPGGWIRIGVPDLEAWAREYLKVLEAALADPPDRPERYDWIVTELVDQLSRQRSGGEMLEYWKQDPMPAEEYVYKRVGNEARHSVASLRKQGARPLEAISRPLDAERDPHLVGVFRTSGQAHLWMYDRYSLGKLLEEAGFTKVCECVAEWSNIPNVPSYRLDIMEDGSVRKPDSLFMEGKK